VLTFGDFISITLLEEEEEDEEEDAPALWSYLLLLSLLFVIEIVAMRWTKVSSAK
jgi:hypothetical protein